MKKHENIDLLLMYARHRNFLLEVKKRAESFRNFRLLLDTEKEIAVIEKRQMKIAERQVCYEKGTN